MMSASLRFGSALSVIALATAIGGCANPMQRVGRSGAGGADMANVGLGTRAQAALAANDYAAAVDLAERAVERTPDDAGMRALLGNAYFASGRFASAEAAYRDSLALSANQPQIVLKLALVSIAQGKNAAAVGLLNGARAYVGASDYGLALALAGQPGEAVTVLEATARQPGADAQVRQNLALAYALSGDWTAARIVASQDLSAELVDARIQQWMAFAKPAAASDQVAALTGIAPAASDPGQPVRLALLREDNSRTAAADVPVVPQPVAAAPVEAVGQVPTFEAMPAAPVAVAEAAPVIVAPVSDALAPVPADPAPLAVAEAAAPVPAFAAPEPKPATAPAKKRRAPIARASGKPGRAPIINASLPRPSGNSSAVVQLGAYGSAERVGEAWHQIARRYGALRAYTPMSARFASSKGMVYRLSVKGFASQREAQGLCAALRKAGGSCFVRTIAGDAPVRIASR